MRMHRSAPGIEADTGPVIKACVV